MTEKTGLLLAGCLALTVLLVPVAGTNDDVVSQKLAEAILSRASAFVSTPFHDAMETVNTLRQMWSDDSPPVQPRPAKLQSTPPPAVASHGRQLEAVSPAAACNGVGASVTSNVTTYYCNGAAVNQTYYNAHHGSQSCNITLVPTAFCICPLDWSGAQCQVPQAVGCVVTLVDPPPACRDLPIADFNPAFDGAPPCLWRKRTDLVTLSAKLNCSFPAGTTERSYADPSQPQLPDALNATAFNLTFSYFVRRGNDFAMSLPAAPAASGRIVNFHRLTDFTGAVLMTLSPAQLVGNTTMNFTLDLSALPDQFFVAGRAFYEITIPDSSRNGLANMKVLASNGFIDLSDWQEPTVAQKQLPTWAVALIGVFVPVIGLSAGFGGWIWWRRRHRIKQKSN